MRNNYNEFSCCYPLVCTELEVAFFVCNKEIALETLNNETLIANEGEWWYSSSVIGFVIAAYLIKLYPPQPPV